MISDVVLAVSPYEVRVGSTLFVATGLLALALGIVIFLSGRREQAPASFLILALTVAVWLSGFGIMYAARDAAVAMEWLEVAYLAVPLIPAALCLFAVAVLQLQGRCRTWLAAVWGVGALFVVLAQGTGLLIAEVHRHVWGYHPHFGPLGPFFLIYFALVSGVAYRQFWVAYRRADEGTVQRRRLHLLLVALGIALVGAVDFIPNFGFALFPISFLPVLVTLGLLAYVVRRFRLVDVTPAFAARQIIETMADGLLVLDRQRTIRVANEVAAELFRRSVSKLEGAPIGVLRPSFLDAADLDRLCVATSLRDFEVVVGNGHGPRTLSVSVSARGDTEGEPEAFVWILREITQRKEAEAALRVSEERFRNVFENTPLGIAVADPDLRFTKVNPAFARLVEYTEEELVQKSFLEITHPDDRGPSEALVRRLFAGSIPSYTLQKRYVTKNGEIRWLNLTATAIRNDVGVPVSVLGLAEDITGRRLLEEELRQAQKMEAIGRLAGGVAHDFNNLLTAILGYADMLRGAMAPGDARIEEVVEIQKAGERAAGLTRQLLAFSRKQILSPKVLDLNGVVRDMEKMLRRLIGEDITLVTRLDPALDAVRADPGQLEQVIVNLAVNSRDAMPDGGTLTLETANRRLDNALNLELVQLEPGTYVTLTVTDTGIGMTSEVQDHLFEPFFTTKEQGKGTGLGLATVYGIVKQSGGEVLVESAPGRGTTFRIYLPTATEEVAARAKEPEPELPGGSETILAVEDEDGVRRLMRQILLRAGYNVLAAPDGEAALAILRPHAGPVHLLLTDMVMPGMTGRELADRATALRPETRVLYVSGYADRGIVRDGQLDPATSLVPKPFTPAILLSRVREALDGHPSKERSVSSSA